MNIKVKIESYDHAGRGIARYNGKVIFVPNAIINEEVEITIIEEKKSFAIGKIVNIISKSPKRIKPLCPYYLSCGGCSYQHLSHEDELMIKTNNLKNIFKKYLNISLEPKIIKSKNEYNYRNKIDLKVENYDFGYYSESSQKFIKINKCLLAKESINNILNKDIIKIKDGNIIIRSNYNDEIIIKIETKDKYDINIEELIKNNKIVGIIVNDKTIYGEDNYIEIIDNYLFKVNINSFFQVNLDILKEIFNILKKNNYHNVIDLYCGVGTLGIPIKKDKLFGIEINKDSIQNALINNKMNKQNNYYMLGDSSTIEKINEKIDTIIVDPPRNGLNKKTLNNILKFKTNNIIYISCNPITLSRDLNILKDEYQIKETYLLDMFPRTKHCESVVILERK